MIDDLRRAADAALTDHMSPGLKAAIDAALARGASKREILARVRRQAGGRNSLAALAVEAYLGCDQEGRLPRA